jgi:uncharacterized protein (DUF58 family)
VGLVTVGTEIREYLRPRSRAGHLLSILRRLANAEPQGPTGLASALHTAAELIPHRGLVVILSDLLDDESQVLNALAHFRYRGHDLIVFQIFDASETRFDFQELTRFEDLEDAAPAVTSEPGALRAGYLAELRRFLERYRTECFKRRIDFVNLDTAQPFDQGLLAYLRNRCGR